MADLIVANSTYGVGTSDSASTIVNNVTAQDAQHINGPVSAILQMQSILGTGTTLKGSLSDLATRLAVSLAADGSLTLDDFLFETGDICTSMRTSKTGWLLMGGTARSNTTYENLLTVVLARLSSSLSSALRTGLAISVTADNTTDLFSSAAHGLTTNQVVYFTSSGSLPAGMSSLTKYYVINPLTNTFQISTTVGGSALNITTNGTGSHSFYKTFVCDARGTTLLCADNADSSSRNNATDTAADNVGQGGGSESSVATHSHSITDPGHTHAAEFSLADGNAFKTSDTGTHGTPPNVVTGISINNTGTSTGNMMPYTTVNFFIKT